MANFDSVAEGQPTQPGVLLGQPFQEDNESDDILNDDVFSFELPVDEEAEALRQEQADMDKKMLLLGLKDCE